MAKLYILIRKTGSKRFIGAIPAKAGATPAKLRVAVNKLKKGFSGKIVTHTQLISLIKKMRPKTMKKRTTNSRKIKRK